MAALHSCPIWTAPLPTVLFLADGPFAVFAGEADDFSQWLPFSLTTAEVWTTGQIMVKRLLEQYKQ